MKRFALAFAIVVLLVGGILWWGDQPERRYEDSACQYRMIYGMPDGRQVPIGLVTLGGSRVRVSTSADHFDKILTRINPSALPVHNLAHSRFSLEKEYVLLRDLLEVRQVKAALVMLKPRFSHHGLAHPDYMEIARLSDIPYAIRALWPERKMAALEAVRGILWEHLRFFDRVKQPPRDTTERNCDGVDYRLNIDRLLEGYRAYQREQGALHWDLSAPESRGFLWQMQAYKNLAEQHNVQIIFIIMTAADERLPPPGFEQAFERITQMKLITLDKDIQNALSMDGRRDQSHINHAGREIFIPWLIEKIESKCIKAEGCF